MDVPLLYVLRYRTRGHCYDVPEQPIEGLKPNKTIKREVRCQTLRTNNPSRRTPKLRGDRRAVKRN